MAKLLLAVWFDVGRVSQGHYTRDSDPIHGKLLGGGRIHDGGGGGGRGVSSGRKGGLIGMGKCC